jgi:3-oxoacyl-[acyl-carrier protein] reductase
MVDVVTGLLRGRVVLVTGAARGLGAAVARVLAAHGAAVAVNYAHSRGPAEAVVAGIEAGGGTAAAFGADVRDPGQVGAMVAGVVDRFGRLDGLVNNAIGGTQAAPFDETTPAGFQTMLDYNCLAVVNTVTAARPHLAAHGTGRVVNVVTEIWNLAPPGWSMYLAGKGAMVGLSRSLAGELGPEGTTVNMVAPGWMVDEKIDPESPESRRFAASLPLRRHGGADEIGNACLFLCSDLAGYVTGAYLPVTGGRITQSGC